ncbi:hypothetical protein Pmar_PMAR008074 [Perkinsus marinus ATCC 50983]|uniref:Uncharacterized protein n=1 Tax=Perkinsus marinus (strain ATCC 50983 / TXsc) TaxID=423536 RepID=C5KD78_PERM5|nr:hypothetical protein Pmar_PMAR008074 [Perkinsus marinus ATCC 50983]EER17511.1 hypothetical protein Pmar_PMAR008074 [Perkinsus marinus ATCC 50983]|eukprot:XP_002785715.1 hypothetical protein Pmar_PMAR008074 [Perkinsus marinus ATCC 50983]
MPTARGEREEALMDRFRYDYHMLVSEIVSESGLEDCYDFLELLVKSGRGNNRGFAFINLKNELFTAMFVDRFQGVHPSLDRRPLTEKFLLAPVANEIAGLEVRDA